MNRKTLFFKYSSLLMFSVIFIFSNNICFAQNDVHTIKSGWKLIAASNSNQAWFQTYNNLLYFYSDSSIRLLNFYLKTHTKNTFHEVLEVSNITFIGDSLLILTNNCHNSSLLYKKLNMDFHKGDELTALKNTLKNFIIEYQFGAVFFVRPKAGKNRLYMCYSYKNSMFFENIPEKYLSFIDNLRIARPNFLFDNDWLNELSSEKKAQTIVINIPENLFLDFVIFTY